MTFESKKRYARTKCFTLLVLLRGQLLPLLLLSHCLSSLLCFCQSSTDNEAIANETVEVPDAGAEDELDLESVLQKTLVGANTVEPSLDTTNNGELSSNTSTATRRRFPFSFFRGSSFIPSRDGPPRHLQVFTWTQSPGGTWTETPSDPDGSLYMSIWQNPDAVHHCHARPCGANNAEENQQESVDEVDSLFGSLSLAD